MKEKIIQASIVLFEQKGFSQTSIQDIVDSLGVTKGTFYYYFTSKEQLLMDIHHDYISELLERQQTILQQDISYTAKLKEVIALLINDIAANGPSGRVFFREVKHLVDGNAETIIEQRDLFRLRIEELIKKGMEAGEFEAHLQAGMIAFGVLGMANYSYNWFDPDGKVTSDQLSGLYTEMILHGISKN